MRKRTFVLGLCIIISLSSLLFIVPFVSAQACVCQGHTCSPGQSQYGADCGNCGTLRSDCTGSCTWGSWYCWNEGVCSPNSTQCVAGRHQTCSASCGWVNDGTDSDGDGTDLECGDNMCDANPLYVNATRVCNNGNITCNGASYDECQDCDWANIGTDGDGDGTDLQCGDSLCDDVPTRTDLNCYIGIARDCTVISEDLFNAIHRDTSHDSQYTNEINAQKVGGIFYSCPPNGGDTAVCHPYSCVYNGLCYANESTIDVENDGITEICMVTDYQFG